MSKECENSDCDFITIGNTELEKCPKCGSNLRFTRSGLFMEQIRVIKEMRDECARQIQLRGTDEPIRPRYMVFENVTGALSSNNGEDFRCVLEETAKIADKSASIPRPERGGWPYAGLIVSDGWSIAYRLHDAQYWGVPQRRKRLCLVCDFNGQSAGDILFELRRETTDSESNIPFSDIRNESRSEVSAQSESMSGDIAESAGEGQETSRDIGESTNKASSYTLKIRGGAERDRYGKRAGKGALVQTELSGTLGVSQDQTLFTKCEPNNDSVVYGIGSYDSNAMKSPNPNSGIYKADTSRTLDLNGGNPACNQGGMAVVCLEGNGSRPSHRGDGYSETETMYTLNSTEQHAVCTEDIKTDNKKQTVYDWRRQDARMTENKDVCVTAEAAWGGGGNNMPYVLEETNKPQTYQDTTGSLMASGYNKLGTQEAANDMFVVQSMEVFHCTSEEDKAQTLKARDYKDPQIVAYPENKDPQMICYGLDRASFNQGKNAQYDFSVEEEKAQTLVSRGPGGVLTKQLEPSAQETTKE